MLEAQTKASRDSHHSPAELGSQRLGSTQLIHGGGPGPGLLLPRCLCVSRCHGSVSCGPCWLAHLLSSYGLRVLSRGPPPAPPPGLRGCTEPLAFRHAEISLPHLTAPSPESSSYSVLTTNCSLSPCCPRRLQLPGVCGYLAPAMGLAAWRRDLPPMGSSRPRSFLMPFLPSQGTNRPSWTTWPTTGWAPSPEPRCRPTAT